MLKLNFSASFLVEKAFNKNHWNRNHVTSLNQCWLLFFKPSAIPSSFLSHQSFIVKLGTHFFPRLFFLIRFASDPFAPTLLATPPQSVVIIHSVVNISILLWSPPCPVLLLLVSRCLLLLLLHSRRGSKSFLHAPHSDDDTEQGFLSFPFPSQLLLSCFPST